MRIWLVFVAVGMLVLLGCGSSQDTVAPAPAPPSMSAGEAIGLVQGELRKTCSASSQYIAQNRNIYFTASYGTKYIHVVFGTNTNLGAWYVYPSGVVQTVKFNSFYCNN